jgi:hypothetical protein
VPPRFAPFTRIARKEPEVPGLFDQSARDGAYFQVEFSDGLNVVEVRYQGHRYDEAMRFLSQEMGNLEAQHEVTMRVTA